MMRFVLVPSFILLCALPTSAQSGPCTESAVKQGNLPAADDMFSYMPRFGRPVVGRAAVQGAGAKAFPGRTNITRSWLEDHRIVATTAGDMAYESGTVRQGYDESGKHHEFEAAILRVYKAKDGACQVAASTMHPLAAQK